MNKEPTTRIQDRPELNTRALYQYLNLRYVPSPETIVSGTRTEPTILVRKPYMQPKQTISLSKLTESTRAAVDQAISTALTEVPDKNKIGAFISGGIDSTIMLHCMNEHTDKTIRTFTMGFGEETDEFADAEKIATHYGTEHRELLVEDIMKDFAKHVDIIGFPKRNLWGYYLAEFASKYVDTIFDGLGGDELFAGYTFRYANALKRPHQTVDQKAVAYLNAAHPRDFVDKCPMLGDRFKGYTVDTVTAPFKEFFQNDLPFMEQLLIADLNMKCAYDFMPLFKLDEAAGLDAKVPLLSPSLVEFACKIPYNLKYDNGIGKYILRKAFPDVPRSALVKEKQGFGVNPSVIWATSLRDHVESTLLDGSVVEEGYIKKEYVVDIMDRRVSESLITHYNKLWDALALEVWCRGNII